MTDKYKFPDGLEMELLSLVADDYESLQTITKCHWDDEIPLPTLEEMVRCLRDLQDRRWVQCYRLDHAAGAFIPIDQFRDDEAENPIEMTGRSTLWWLITEDGLKAHREHFGAPVLVGINGARAKHILEVVSNEQMSATTALEKWPVERDAPWPEPAVKAYEILRRLAGSDGVGPEADQRRAELRQLAKELDT